MSVPPLVKSYNFKICDLSLPSSNMIDHFFPCKGRDVENTAMFFPFDLVFTVYDVS